MYAVILRKYLTLVSEKFKRRRQLQKICSVRGNSENVTFRLMSRISRHSHLNEIIQQLWPIYTRTRWEISDEHSLQLVRFFLSWPKKCVQIKTIMLVHRAVHHSCWTMCWWIEIDSTSEINTSVLTVNCICRQAQSLVVYCLPPVICRHWLSVGRVIQLVRRIAAACQTGWPRSTWKVLICCI